MVLTSFMPATRKCGIPQIHTAMIEYITPEHILSNLANLPQLVFEVTDACNLKCKYCAYGEFYGDFDKRENKMLSVDSAERLIDYLNHYWNSERITSAKSFMYISFYGGEPLMNFGFIKKIVDYVETRLDCPRRKFLFSMTTNAILHSSAPIYGLSRRA